MGLVVFSKTINEPVIYVILDGIKFKKNELYATVEQISDAEYWDYTGDYSIKRYNLLYEKAADQLVKLGYVKRFTGVRESVNYKPEKGKFSELVKALDNLSFNGSIPKKDNEADRNERIYSDYFEEKKADWLSIISDRLRDYSEGNIWADGNEILCRTESAANAIADMLQTLYKSQGEDVVIKTGFYDPNEDEANNECDRYTGWWYVNID